MKLAIIAGGKGTRLGFKDIPKPMVRLNGIPVIEYQILLAKKYGLNEIFILTGHLGNVIEDYFGDGNKLKVKIKYIKETFPLGTSGSVKQLESIIDEDFMVFYGDTVMDINLKKMISFHKKNNGIGSLLIHPNDHPYDSDLIELDYNSNMVTSIHSKPHGNKLLSNKVNAALYILSPKIFKYIEKNKSSDFGKDIFTKLINSKEKLFAYESAEYIKDMGTSDRMIKIEGDIQNGKVKLLNSENKRNAIFLDRDGVINKEVDNLSNISDFELLPGVVDAIKNINESNYLAIIVTNQPVISKGFCTIKDLENIHNKLEFELSKKGAYIDRIFYCPHHPDKGFEGEIESLKINCDCRKPKTGMIKDAIKKFNINIKESFIIGDRTVDIKTGKNIKLKTVLVKTGYAGNDNKYKSVPDFIFKDLNSAINNILKK